MGGEYVTVKGFAMDSFTEKKSEFIGQICHVSDPDEAVRFIEEVRAKHRKARHNVYAYLPREGTPSRYSDDGEPQGTGGTPVLDVLMKEELTDVCVVVTRYFGGILLGGGGLVRAYSHACKLAVDAAVKMRMCLCSRFDIGCDYSLYGKLTYIMPEFGAKLVEEVFADEVRLSVLVKEENADGFAARITDISNGSIVPEIEKGLWRDMA